MEKKTRKTECDLAAVQTEGYARAHFADQDLSLGKVCEALHYNYGYLSAAFKRRYGLSFSEFVSDLRLTHAAALLIKGESPVSEVAKSVGFKDALYFSKAFHRRYGLSPTEYREKHKGEQGWYSRFYVT
jgi:two-component system response regulator YesN